MDRVPLYVSGKEHNKFINIYKNFNEEHKYFIPQEHHEGLFGLFGNPFHRVYKDYDNDEKYYFPIIISLFDIIDTIKDHMVISTSVLKDIKRKKCKILLVCPFEGWSWDYWQDFIDRIITKYAKLDYKHFVVLSGNLVKHKQIKSIYFNFFERQCLYNNLDDLQYSGTDRVIEKKHKDHKFLYMNRRPHYFRIAAVSLFFEDRKKGLMSLGFNGEMGPGYYEAQEKIFKNYFSSAYKIYEEKNLKNQFPLVIHDGIDAERDNPVNDKSVDKFYNSYLHIVAETYHHYTPKRAFFSEKIFKPIMFMQPFVIIGEAYALENLKSLGYQTFDKIIDESYDTIVDDNERLYASVKSAKDFYNKPREELNDIMMEILPILKHNISHLYYRCQMNDVLMKNQLLEFLYE